MNWPLASSTWASEEKLAMQEVLESGFFTMGSKTLKFEKEFAKWANRKYAVMVNSGSSANLVGATAIRYTRDSDRKFNQDGNLGEVIVPAVSWSTTYFPFTQNRYKLVFADIDIKTYNVDVNSVRNAITKNTVGIVGVNLLGNPANWEELKSIALEFNLWLVEDNCESMGAVSPIGTTGTFGEVSTFSFFYSHHICTMEGGMAVTDDEDIYLAMRSIRAHGWAREVSADRDFLGSERGNPWEENFRFYLPGYNLRPLELSAAVGSVQLSKIDWIVQNRRQNASKMIASLAQNKTSWSLQESYTGSSWFTFGFINHHKVNGNLYRNNLIKILDREGIQSRPIVAGNFSKNPVCKWLDTRIDGVLESAEVLDKCGLMVGNHHFDLSELISKFPAYLNESESE
jgi:CDP-6-deoxy-D-xylo-4-hexulose-3-dehydrase